MHTTNTTTKIINLTSTLLKRFLFVLLTQTILLSNSYAETEQLDIINLIPSKSTKDQVFQASQNNSGSAFKIGGYEFIECKTEFRNDKLDKLRCLFGLDPFHSNSEIFSTLKNGYIQKFGNPDSVKVNPLKNRLGNVIDNQVIVKWKDKQGNELVIYSFYEQFDSRMFDPLGKTGEIHDLGLITIFSSDYIKDQLEKDAAEQKLKKF